MANLWFQSLAIAGLAVAISLLVALLIKGIVVFVGLSRQQDQSLAAPSTPSPSTSEIPPEDVAAISAAVYAVLGTRRIVHIEPRFRGQVWTAEGRVSHHVSHAPQRASRRRS